MAHGAAPRPARAVMAVAAAIVTVMLAGCDTESEEAGNEAEQQSIAVTFVIAASRKVQDVERAVGSFVAKSAPHLAAEVSGTVKELLVDAGDKVKKGEVLSRIEDGDYRDERDRAKAAMRRVEVLIEQQEREVARQRRLRSQGHVSASALEDAEADLEARREEHKVLSSDVGSAERNVGRTTIRAPYSGSIARRLVSVGDYVDSGTVVFEMTRESRLLVHIPLPERLADRLRPGLEVRLVSSTTPDEPVIRHVTQVTPQVGSSRAVTAIAEVDNPGQWRAGSSVDAQVVLDERDSIVLPADSLVRRPGGTVVYVLDGNVARERAVETGIKTSEWVEIISGVEAGEPVVRDGAGFLSDGTAVKAEPHDPPPRTSMDGEPASLRG